MSSVLYVYYRTPQYFVFLDHAILSSYCTLRICCPVLYVFVVLFSTMLSSCSPLCCRPVLHYVVVLFSTMLSSCFRTFAYAVSIFPLTPMTVSATSTYIALYFSCTLLFSDSSSGMGYSELCILIFQVVHLYLVIV
jgi:hypothetical protein